MRWLGGIPVNRQSSTNFVQQLVAVFDRHERFIMAIAPEGTRDRVTAWKTGFYYIALGARVPIALGFVDYRTRTVGIGPTIVPSGDIHADFARIQAFYAEKQGRHPALQGAVHVTSLGRAHD